MADAMEGYSVRAFTGPLAEGRSVTHDVYERGEGPPIVIIQEMPGIGPQTLRLSERFIDEGLRVVLPHLFGPLGRVSTLGNAVRVLCLRREFHLFAKDASSPIVDWLKALCHDVRDREGVDGVGVIGMCLTGNFAISLMADDSVLAGVASQPSLPFFDQSALHMSDEEVTRATARLDEQGAMMALRFAGDKVCTAAKFDAIAQRFNTEDKQRIHLKTLPGDGHSVLTLDFSDEDGHPTRNALDEVLRYFTDKLRTPTAV